MNNNITIAELANVFSTTEKNIRYYIDKLRSSGMIERKGSTKSGDKKE